MRLLARRLVSAGVASGAFGSCALVGPPVAARTLTSARMSMPPPPTPGRFKLALCQVSVDPVDKAANLRTAESAVREAAGAGAQLICLPEVWNSPYEAAKFPEYAEEVPAAAEAVSASAHPSTHMLCSVAKELGVYLVGGSIPERDASSVYNTCVVVGPDGAVLCKHRKMHLFDIDIPGKMTFRESDTLTGGGSLSIFDTPWGRVGVGICYDIRFPQLAMLYRAAGAHMLCYPGAFNMTTGPLHWELLGRARANDNQLFVAMTSPARNPAASYQAWGHSTVISPWGEVVATTGHEPAMVYADVDLSEVEAPRQGIPVSFQKRNDLYSEVAWKGGA